MRNIKQQAARALEDVSAALHKERLEMDSKFTKADSYNGSRRIVENQMIVRKHYTSACKTAGSIFESAGRNGEFEASELETGLREVLAEWWQGLEQEINNSYIQHHKKGGISPTWDEIVIWMEREVALTVENQITALFSNETPTIKQLKGATPENWKAVFARADDNDLHAIIEGSRVMASPTVQEWARAELRKRENAAKEAEIARTERHAEKLTNRQIIWGIIGGVACTVIGFFLGVLYTSPSSRVGELV